MALSSAWHEDDDLWQELLPVLVDPSALSAASGEAADAARLLQVQPGVHLLDLGCGPGRHSLALTGLGYRVTGVDRTAVYLAEARRRISAAGVEIELVHQSMLEFKREGAFDGAISLFTSFGYFEDRKDDLRVLRNVHASLRPGARLALETIGKEVLARIFDPRHWQELGNGRYWLQDREMSGGWEKMRNRWVFVGGGVTKEFTFEHRIFSGVELADLFRAAGFEDVAVYGALDGRPYDRDSIRLVVVGRK